MSKQKTLNTLKIIRICYDMSQIEFSTYFGCKSVHISEIESGKKKLSQKKLEFGLQNLCFNYEYYLELETYKKYVESLDKEYIKKYQMLLLKGLKLTEKCLNEQGESHLLLKKIKEN